MHNKPALEENHFYVLHSNHDKLLCFLENYYSRYIILTEEGGSIKGSSPCCFQCFGYFDFSWSIVEVGFMFPKLSKKKLNQLDISLGLRVTNTHTTRDIIQSHVTSIVTLIPLWLDCHGCFCSGHPERAFSARTKRFFRSFTNKESTPVNYSKTGGYFSRIIFSHRSICTFISGSAFET